MNASNILKAFLASAFLASTAPAAVFVDNFNNGTAADSDNTTGFWTTALNSTAGTANAISESGGNLQLTAGDNAGDNSSANSGVYVVSSVLPEFNFFDNSLTVEVRGISFSGNTTIEKQQLRVAFTSEAKNSYGSNDTIVTRIFGNGIVALGNKNGSSNSPTSTTQVADVGSSNGVTGFDLTLAPAAGTLINYNLTVYGGSGGSSNGSFNINEANWGTSGNSALLLWAQEDADTSPGESFTASVGSVTVIPEPGTIVLVGLAFGVLYVTRRRRE